jgi:hypothetical protein
MRARSGVPGAIATEGAATSSIGEGFPAFVATATTEETIPSREEPKSAPRKDER